MQGPEDSIVSRNLEKFIYALGDPSLFSFARNLHESSLLAPVSF